MKRKRMLAAFDLNTRRIVLKEIYRISYTANPKIWLGIKWLCTYIQLSPDVLLELKERHINAYGRFILPKHLPELVDMLDEDIRLYQALPYNPPNRYFLSHPKSDRRIDEGYLRQWWNWACENLALKNAEFSETSKYFAQEVYAESIKYDNLIRPRYQWNNILKQHVREQQNKQAPFVKKLDQMFKAAAHSIPTMFKGEEK